MPDPLLVFDVGSTLIHPNFATLADWLAEKTCQRFEAGVVERAFRKAVAGDPFALNDHDHQAAAFFTLCGCSQSPRARWSEWWEEIVRAGGAGSWLYTLLDVDARSVLEGLKRQGCRLVAASNCDGTLRAELEGFALAEFFEATYDSADLGSEKPHADFYAHVLRAAGAATGVHIGDDLIKDFIGPLASGFQQAILYDPANVYEGLPRNATVRKLSEIEVVLGLRS